jgi:hypothetical protein
MKVVLHEGFWRSMDTLRKWQALQRYAEAFTMRKGALA